MRILLANDDGILAPGLSAMRQELCKLGEVLVAAPESPQSAAAHAITVGDDIAVSRVHVHDAFYGHAVSGSPADAVKIALAELLDERPDLVVSGINAGANVGINVLYSGTVAAAAEGAFFGVPSVAVSLEFSEELEFARAAEIGRAVIESLLAAGLTGGKLINVNIPALRPGVPRGVRIARQSTRAMEDRYECRRQQDGRRWYTLKGEFANTDDEPATDLRAIREGYVAVTPLHFDLTDDSQMDLCNRIAWPGLGESS
jgi:5'-nucleotidase